MLKNNRNNNNNILNILFNKCNNLFKANNLENILFYYNIIFNYINNENNENLNDFYQIFKNSNFIHSIIKIINKKNYSKLIFLFIVWNLLLNV